MRLPNKEKVPGSSATRRHRTQYRLEEHKDNKM